MLLFWSVPECLCTSPSRSTLAASSNRTFLPATSVGTTAPWCCCCGPAAPHPAAPASSPHPRRLEADCPDCIAGTVSAPPPRGAAADVAQTGIFKPPSSPPVSTLPSPSPPPSPPPPPPSATAQLPHIGILAAGGASWWLIFALSRALLPRLRSP